MFVTLRCIKTVNIRVSVWEEGRLLKSLLWSQAICAATLGFLRCCYKAVTLATLSQQPLHKVHWCLVTMSFKRADLVSRLVSAAEHKYSAFFFFLSSSLQPVVDSTQHQTSQGEKNGWRCFGRRWINVFHSTVKQWVNGKWPETLHLLSQYRWCLQSWRPHFLRRARGQEGSPVLERKLNLNLHDFTAQCFQSSAAWRLNTFSLSIQSFTCRQDAYSSTT